MSSSLERGGKGGAYEADDVVWVKLGARWWPGYVVSYDSLPDDVRKSFRKVPIAVVHFFQEDSFEYVKNENFIAKYNCSRKHDFIKKGLELFRSGQSHMEKFPGDVKKAEELTHGDPNILDSEEFQPEKKTGYAGIFGDSPTKTPGKGRGRPTSSAKVKIEDSPKITHPRLIKKYHQGTSDYKARILVQQSNKTDTTSPQATPTSGAPSECNRELLAESPRVISTPSTPSQGVGAYSCHACSFTATRLNVMVLHNKSHSAGFIPYTPPKKHKASPPPKQKTSPPQARTASPAKAPPSPEKKPRGRPKKTQLEETTNDFPLPEIKPSPGPSKRKGSKNKDKEAKKPKTDVEIKNSLLADWSEGSDDSLDLIIPQKVDDQFEDKPENANLNLEDVERVKDEKCESMKVDSEVKSDLTATKDKLGKARKHTSCFDFNDEEEMPIESIGRKIPRLSSKSEDAPKKVVDVESDKLEKTEDKPAKDSLADLDSEINNLLQETIVPELPELPSLPADVKFGENHDKEEIVDTKQTGKAIFKTKAFFRNRHSRSQEAIEKYVADNTSTDKPPTYMEEPVEPEPTPHTSTQATASSPTPAEPEHKVVKLAPKIQLKKMKLGLAEKLTPKSLIPTIEPVKADIGPVFEDVKDRWDNDSVTELLKTDNLDDKMTESFTKTTNDLLGSIDFDSGNTETESKPIASKKSKILKEGAKESAVEKTKCEETKVDAKKCGDAPSDSVLQIAETLINLPVSAIPPSDVFSPTQEKPSAEDVAMAAPEPVSKTLTDSDKSFFAAESLVQMSETFQNEIQNVTTLGNLFTGEPEHAEKEKEESLPDPVAMKSPPKADIKSPKSALGDSPKLFQILEEPTKTKPPLKILSSKIITSQGKEKILNFDVSGTSPKAAAIPPQKNKVIIKKTTKVSNPELDRFGDSPQDKLVLSSSKRWKEGDVQTFTIERPAMPKEELSKAPLIKPDKVFPGKQRVVSKPQNAIITSTGRIVSGSEKDKKEDDMLFDINSMPIVLSDEMSTLDSMDNASFPTLTQSTISTPTVSKATVSKVTPQPKNVPKIIAGSIINSNPAIIRKYGMESSSMKPSNFIIKPFSEKSASPNILSKSTKTKALKHMLVLDQKTGEQKLILAKQDDSKVFSPATKIIKSSPNIISQSPKSDKVSIIVPSSGNTTKFSPAAKQQKIIINSQTGKQTIIAPSETFTSGQTTKSTVTKVIQNRSSADPATGNTMFILTNAQGGQSKIVLTPEHQRLLFPKKTIQSATISPQSTSKGPILTPMPMLRGKNTSVTSQSIITSRGQIMTPISGNTLITSSGQIIPSQQMQPLSKMITKQKGNVITSKGQLLLASNTSNRTILTARPNQTILTSRGQLITTQSNPVNTQSKMISNITTVATSSSSNQQMRLLKTSSPQKVMPGKVNHGLLLQTSSKGDKPNIITGRPSTIMLKTGGKVMSPAKPVMGKGKDSPAPQQTVISLTQAQFEQLQKTGDINQFLPKANQIILQKNQQGKTQAPKVIFQKITNKPMNVAEKKQLEQGIKHKLQTYSHIPPLAPLQPEQAPPPIKKQKLRELLTLKSDQITAKKQEVLAKAPPKQRVIEKYKAAERQAQVAMELENLDDLIPATTISTRKPDTPSVFANIETSKSEQVSQLSEQPHDNIIMGQEANVVTSNESMLKPMEASLNEDIAQTLTAKSLESGQLLAVPGESLGGAPNTFYLCLEENGTLTPIDNQPLVLENNNLVPMVMAAPATELPILETPQPLEAPVIDSQVLNLPAEQAQQNNILINMGDQQILLDQQTLHSLLSGDGQQLVTADGQQLVLQGNVQQFLAALASNPEIASLLQGGQQIILNAGGTDPGTGQPLPVPAEQAIAQDTNFFTQSSHAPANQDILAAALANTDVFQPEPLISDALQIATSNTEGMLMEMDSLSPNFQNLNASVSVHSHVSETSTTLNQPIMSPLEVPSKKRVSNEAASPSKTLDSMPQNLEDSLAVIGVTPPNIPTSLDLPITVTNPRIAPKTTNPLSLSCGVVYSPGLITNSMISPNMGLTDSDLASNRLDLDFLNISSKESPLNSTSSSTNFKNENSSSLPSTDMLNVSSPKKDDSRLQGGKPSGPASSMPCLDDSSSESFVEENPQKCLTKIQTKTYSPISMPLLTEDAIDEPVTTCLNAAIESTNNEANKSMPVLLDPEEFLQKTVPMDTLKEDLSTTSIPQLDQENNQNTEFDQVLSKHDTGHQIDSGNAKSIEQTDEQMPEVTETPSCDMETQPSDSVMECQEPEVQSEIQPSENISLQADKQSNEIVESQIPDAMESEMVSQKPESNFLSQDDLQMTQSAESEYQDQQPSALPQETRVEEGMNEEPSAALAEETKLEDRQLDKPETELQKEVMDLGTNHPIEQSPYEPIPESDKLMSEDINEADVMEGDAVEQTMPNEYNAVMDDFPDDRSLKQLDDGSSDENTNGLEPATNQEGAREEGMHQNSIAGDYAGTENNHHAMNDESMADLDIAPSSVPEESCDSPMEPQLPCNIEDIELPPPMHNEADGNSLPDHMNEEYDHPVLITDPVDLDMIPLPEGEPISQQQFIDDSSNDSSEIPIQPNIVVSQQHLMQNLNNSEEDKSKGEGESKEKEEEIFSSKSSPKRFKFDDER